MPASLQDSLSEWTLIGGKEGLQTPSPDTSSATIDHLPIPPASLRSGADLTRVSSEPVTNTLEQVLDLHTSKRMKPSFSASRYRKPKMGVSIPSQQRWLSYWSQVLLGNGPLSLRLFSTGDHLEQEIHREPQFTKVKLTKLTVRMRDLSGMQPCLVQVANIVITSTGRGREPSESTTGRLWASLARYRDGLVDELECWEKEFLTSPDAMRNSPFRNDKWDKAKMVHSFAKMGVSNIESARRAESVCIVAFYFHLPNASS